MWWHETVTANGNYFDQFDMVGTYDMVGTNGRTLIMDKISVVESPYQAKPKNHGIVTFKPFMAISSPRNQHLLCAHNEKNLWISAATPC
jgi:hypothetical protein